MLTPRTVWGAFLLLGLGATFSTAAPPAEYDELMKKGDAARNAQQWKKAQAAFATAYEIADKSGERHAQAEAAIKCALAFRGEASSFNGEKRSLPEPQPGGTPSGQSFWNSPAITQAISWYDKALKYGDKKQMALAGNNLGVIYVQRGQFDKAVLVYRRYVVRKPATDTWEPATDDPVFLCNFAQALEKSANDNSRQEAFDIYWRVLRGVQQFPRAADGIVRILLKSTPANVAEAIRLLDFLLPVPDETADDRTPDKPRQIELAGRALHEFLKAWEDRQEVERLIPRVIRYNEFAVATPNDVFANHTLLLQGLRKSSSPSLMIGEIRWLYGDNAFRDLGGLLSEDPYSVWRELPALRKIGQGDSKEAKDVRSALSSLLVHIGDYFYRESLNAGGGRNAPALAPERAARHALARYAAAYQLDLTNARAALNVAATLHEHPKVFSPDLERQFVDLLWNSKIDAYRKLQPRNKDDWATIAAFHRILGSIFEKDPNSSKLHAENPRSPVYQWDHAVTAAKRVQEIDKDYPANPNLHVSLAKSWEQAKVPAKAFNSYLDAAEGFQKSRNGEKATLAVADASRIRTTLGASLDPSQRQRYDTIAKHSPPPDDKRTSDDLIKTVKLSVHTTRNDKDRDTSWHIRIYDGNTTFADIETGAGDPWRGGSNKDISIKLDRSFRYADRQSVKMKITQKSRRRDSWEGNLSVTATVGNSQKDLISRTRDFKLGGNNSSEASFTFK